MADRWIESSSGSQLFAEVEALEKLVVLLEVVLLQVVEKLTTASCHGEKPAACVEVLAIGAKVLGEVVDASREKGDLDVSRTSVGVVGFEVANYLGFIDCFAVSHLCVRFFELARKDGRAVWLVPNQVFAGLDADASVEAPPRRRAV